MFEVSYGKCKLKCSPLANFLFLLLCTAFLLMFEGGYQTDNAKITANPKHVPVSCSNMIISNSNTVGSQGTVTTQVRNSLLMRRLNTVETRASAPTVVAFINGVISPDPALATCKGIAPPPGNQILEDAMTTGTLPAKDVMCTMSIPHLDTLLQRYMNTIQILCGSSMARMGARKDGGWDVCPNVRYLQKDNCLVYSFGINNDFTFDDEIARQYGCKVHSFDPSMRKADHIRSQKPFVSFHATGLSNINGTQNIHPKGQWKMRTLGGIRQDLGHTQVIPDVLKMDIEFSEWSALPDMIHKTPIHDLPNQLIAEFHYFVFKTDLKSHWLKVLFILKDLYDVGYRTAWISRNLDINCIKLSPSTRKWYYLCHEVTYLKINPTLRRNLNVEDMSPFINSPSVNIDSGKNITAVKNVTSVKKNK